MNRSVELLNVRIVESDVQQPTRCERDGHSARKTTADIRSGSPNTTDHRDAEDGSVNSDATDSGGQECQKPATCQQTDRITNGFSNLGFVQNDARRLEFRIDVDTSSSSDPISSCTSVNTTSDPEVAKDPDPTSLTGLLFATLKTLRRRHRDVIRRAVTVTMTSLYLTYFSYAMYYRFGDDGSIVLLVLTAAAAVGLSVSAICNRFRKRIKEALDPLDRKISRHGALINWTAALLIIVSVIVFIIVDVVVLSKNVYNLVSASGIVVYVFLFYLFSKHRSKVRWVTVVWGFALQLVFAVCILRTEAGYRAFEWLGSRVTDFFSFSDEGAKFVFGETSYLDHFFVFKVMPTVVFFSTAVSVLYHLGAMQIVITKIAMVMQVTMGTTAGESLTAAANIFIGQSEAPLLIGPLLPDMTSSELHAVMTGGFATITGGIMAAYILLGVPANHLISASVMSAPAALAMSKLIHPETEDSKTTVNHLKTALQKRSDDNVIGALSSGASSSIKIVACVVANLIAFIATLHLLNALLTWVGQRVGVDQLTFQLICSYALWPFAFVMGVEFRDCRKVAQLIGVKTMLNEFIAYTELGGYIENRKLFDAHVSGNGSWYDVGDAVHLVSSSDSGRNHNATVLVGGILSDRSIAIATYALCGFSNFSSMGIVLGGLASMAPTRKKQLASGVLTAMIAGNVACFITACIAGLLFTPV